VTLLKRCRCRADGRDMGRRIALPLFAAAFVADLASKAAAVHWQAGVIYHPVPDQMARRVLMSALAIGAAVAFTHAARRRGLGRPWGAWIGVPLLVAGVLANGISTFIWSRGVPDFIPTGEWTGNIADFEIFFGIVGGILALMVGFCLSYARSALAR
jgi:hypothetical protein